MNFKNQKLRKVYFKTYADVRISKAFKHHPPKPEKLNRKRLDFIQNGYLDPIVVDENFFLRDGYCTYLFAKEFCLPPRRVKIYRLKGVKK